MSKLNLSTIVALHNTAPEDIQKLNQFHSVVVLFAMLQELRESTDSLQKLINIMVETLSNIKNHDIESTECFELSNCTKYRYMVQTEISDHINSSHACSAAANFTYMSSILTDTRLYAETGMRVPVMYPYSSQSKGAIRKLYKELLSVDRAYRVDPMVMLLPNFNSVVVVGVIAFVSLMLSFEHLGDSGISGNGIIAFHVVIWLLLTVGVTLFRGMFKKMRFDYNYSEFIRLYTYMDGNERVCISNCMGDGDVSLLAPTTGNSITDRERELIESFITKIVTYTNEHKTIAVDNSPMVFDIKADDVTFARQARYILRRVDSIWKN